MPISHPSYYDNRLSIRLIESKVLNIKEAEIEKNKYEITKEKIETLKSLLCNNFNSLISIALKQGTKEYFGGETSLNIKIKSVYIMIDCYNLVDDDKIFVNSLIEKIVNIIKD